MNEQKNFIQPINLSERNMLLWQIWTSRRDVLARIDQVFKGKLHEPRKADGLCISHLEELPVSAARVFDDVCRIGYRLTKVYAALTPDRNRGVVNLLFVRKLREDEQVIDFTAKKQPTPDLDRAVELARMLMSELEGATRGDQQLPPIPYSATYSWDNGPDRPLTLILNRANPAYPLSELIELRLNGTGARLESAAVLKRDEEHELKLNWQYADGLPVFRATNVDEAERMNDFVLRTY